MKPLIRLATGDDLGFIFSSWLKSYRSSPFGKQRNLTNNVFFDEHHMAIERMLKRAQVAVAANEEDENQIFGWICGETDTPIPVLHYMYVKHPYRRLGIGKELFKLVPDGHFLYTHDTGLMHHFSRYGVYNPYAFFK